MPKKIKSKRTNLMPAIPPEDYAGSVGQWMTELQTRGLWDGQNPDWHGDVMISEKDWWDILEACEGPDEEDEI